MGGGVGGPGPGKAQDDGPYRSGDRSGPGSGRKSKGSGPGRVQTSRRNPSGVALLRPEGRTLVPSTKTPRLHPRPVNPRLVSGLIPSQRTSVSVGVGSANMTKGESHRGRSKSRVSRTYLRPRSLAETKESRIFSRVRDDSDLGSSTSRLEKGREGKPSSGHVLSPLRITYLRSHLVENPLNINLKTISQTKY